MRFRNLALSIMFAAVLACIAPSVSGQNVFVTVPQPRVSVPNQIIDFYAGGTTGGYSLRISPQGGTLSINDYVTMDLMPWGYVTAQWTTGRVYIIFLVNVTQTDFRIGFLYLTNSTDEPFLLRWFDYNSASVNLWTFQGAQHVYNRTVSTGSVELPRLQIPISTTATNDIYALGPQLYLTSKSGRLLNGTSLLDIYPVMNQLFTGPTDYNEVWSLLADEFGNYYFAILYMQNSDSSHVILEHQLRFNDYRRLNGQTLNAKWAKGAFEHQVTVRTAMPNVTVKVDGFPFQTNNNGVVSIGVPIGQVTVEVPNDISDSTNTKLRFFTWSKYGSSNPLSILVNSSLDITAKYDHEYTLVVNSEYGSPQGSGWYLQGTNATFSVENNIEYGNGTRQVFQQWSGDSNSTEAQAWTILSAPKQVEAQWKTQYAVSISAVGLPAGVGAVVIVDGLPFKLNGSAVHTVWVDANRQLTITVQSAQIQSSNSNYFFSELRADNQTFSGALDITKPVQVALVYTESQKLGTSISLEVLPSVAAAGYPVSITGSVVGLSGETGVVDLLYSSANNGWQELAKVPVTQNGAFAYTWQPNASGNYSIEANWPGDSNHSPASRVIGVKVLDSSALILAGSGALANLVQSGFAAAKEVPYLSALIGLAASLMMLGYVLTSFVVPGGSPIVGYFIGSIFVGFVYVFPVSAAVVLFKSASTRRRPSLVWLTPLLTIWMSSLLLVALGPVIAALPLLVLASQILLVLSTMFLVPLFAAFRLAKVVAT